MIPLGQTLIVGFMCKYPDAAKFNDKAWVEVVGSIEKGTYHSEIPIVKVTNIKEVEKPEDIIVNPPDDYYIPTSVLF